MSKNKNLVEFVRIMLKWKRLILIVTVIAIVGSIVLAVLQPNYYKSTTIFYPNNLGSFDRSYLFGTGERDKIQSMFGSKQDVNRVISIANSSELIGQVIDHYNLTAHYNIDSTNSDWRYKVMKEFSKNFKVIKSELDNIELSVWDRDPDKASQIANYFVMRINQIYSSLLVERNKSNATSIEERLNEINESLKKVSDSLIVVGNSGNANYKALIQMQENLLEELNHWNSLSNQYKAVAGNNFKSLFIIEQAYPAERKDRPVRWIIVVSATLIAFVLSIFASLFFEKYKEIRQEL